MRSEGKDRSPPHPQTHRPGSQRSLSTAAMGQDHGGTASQDARGLSGLSPRHSIWLLRWACTLEQESLESHVIRKAVMRGSEEGRWKSTHLGNSLAAYPTARTVPRGGKCRETPTYPDSTNRWASLLVDGEHAV